MIDLYNIPDTRFSASRSPEHQEIVVPDRFSDVKLSSTGVLLILFDDRMHIISDKYRKPLYHFHIWDSILRFHRKTSLVTLKKPLQHTAFSKNGLWLCGWHHDHQCDYFCIWELRYGEVIAYQRYPCHVRTMISRADTEVDMYRRGMGRVVLLQSFLSLSATSLALWPATTKETSSPSKMKRGRSVYPGTNNSTAFNLDRFALPTLL